MGKNRKNGGRKNQLRKLANIYRGVINTGEYHGYLTTEFCEDKQICQEPEVQYKLVKLTYLIKFLKAKHIPSTDPRHAFYSKLENSINNNQIVQPVSLTN